MPLRRQGKSARNGEVEDTRIAGYLSDDEGQIAATHPFLECEERILGSFRERMHDAAAQNGRKAMPVRSASETYRRPILHP